MLDALLIIIILLLMASLLVAFVAAIWVSSGKTDGATKIKFKHFRTMYYVSPDKWIIQTDDYPVYKKEEDYYSNRVAVYFGLCGTIAYFVFAKNVRRHNEHKKQNESLAELTCCFQKDIEQYKTEIDKFLKDKLNKL